MTEGGGGVQKCPILHDVIYEWSLSVSKKFVYIKKLSRLQNPDHSKTGQRLTIENPDMSGFQIPTVMGNLQLQL